MRTSCGADSGSSRTETRPQDPQGEFRGKNILYASQSIAGPRGAQRADVDAIEAALARARQTLFEARAKRPRPHLDDKILTAWNGLMIAALARAARVLAGRPAASTYWRPRSGPRRSSKDTLWRERDQRLLRRYRDGEAAIEATPRTTRS